MRSVRFMAIAAAALALTACGANSTSTDGSEEGNTSLEAPQPPAEKWSAMGDVCEIVTADTAFKILGQPVKQFTEGDPSQLSDDPRVIDACNYSYMYEGKPNDDYADDKVYTANVLVWTNGREVLEEAAQLAGDKYEITKYQVDGYDEVFYANSEANVIVGGLLVSVNNGATGKFESKSLVRFALFVHAFASNR